MDGWSLKYMGEIEGPDGGAELEKSFEDWGLSVPTLQSVNQGLDVLTMEQPGADFTSEDTFEKGEVAIISLDGVRKFYGRFRKPKRRGSAEGESMSWRLEGPWYWLRQTVFRQPVFTYSDLGDDESPLVTKYSGRLYLGTKIEGDTVVYQDSAAQIQEIVAWCVAQGGHLALDTEDLPVIQFPVREITNRSCAEAIIMCLQLCPDATAWFDYTTEPYPTLKIKRQSKQTIVNLNTTSGYQLEVGEISARDDLQTEGVVIEYERTTTVNGKPLKNITYDIWPEGISGTGPNVLLATIDLEGGSVNEAIGTLSVASMDPTTKAFWQTVRPDLADHLDENGQSLITIKDLTVKPMPRLTNLPRRIVAGAWADWMPGRLIEEEIRALVSYKVEVKDKANSNQAFIREEFVDKLVTFRAKLTDLPQGNLTYRSSAVEAEGEPVPVGMAKALYLATSGLPYEGEVTITEKECSGLVKMGNQLNLLDGLEEYETMNALVQEVTQNFETGQTIVRFGTASHLGPEDIMEYLRALRNRQRFTGFFSRATGISGRGGQTMLPSQYEKDMLAEGTYARTKQTYYDPAAVANSHRVVIDIADLKALGVTAETLGDIRMRVYQYCLNNEQWQIVALGSKPVKIA